MERKSNVDRLPMHFTSGLNDGSAISDRQDLGGAEGIRQAARKPALLAYVRSLIRREQPDQTISRLARQVEARERFIEEQRAYIGHGRRILEKASAAAGIGIWECELPTETLYWSGGTYDLFGVPRGARVTRTDTLRSYTEKSLASLQAARGQAIADLTGFELDAEIETPIGNHRWIRITATVESENGRAARIFGLKRDITEEKRKWEAARYLAEFDPMTGLANRAQFEAKLLELCRGGAGALLLVDLDNFKQVNDTVGHAGGDECLKRAADRISKACHAACLVARMGGDEFAVLVGPGGDRETACDLAGRIVATMRNPVLCEDRPFIVGASVGIAAISGRSPTDVYKAADMALYLAKSAGGATSRYAD